jgi:hypothetical protein
MMSHVHRDQGEVILHRTSDDRVTFEEPIPRIVLVSDVLFREIVRDHNRLAAREEEVKRLREVLEEAMEYEYGAMRSDRRPPWYTKAREFLK